MLDYPTAPRATEAVETLICSVEEFLSRLPVAADSELSRLRAKATSALTAAKAAVAGTVAPVSEQADPFAATSLAACVREWPGTAIAVAALLGLALGLRPGRHAQRLRRSSPLAEC